MKTPVNLPGDEQLRGLLRESRAERPLPAGFERAVWRRIQAANAAKTSSVASPWWAWLDQLAESWLRPRYAMAAITIVLLAGLVTGLFGGMNDARALSRDRYLASVAPHAAR